jgi:diacylglycerol diphosphate phosphatase / phosphatidate phosphatase
MRGQPFGYGAGGASYFDRFHDAIFTRKAGWGHEGFSMGGAPFDSAGLGGATGGAFHSGAQNGYSNGVTSPTTNGHHGRHSIERRPVPSHGENMV